MWNENYEDPRRQETAEREEHEKESSHDTPQTPYAKRRRMLEKDEWYSLLDEHE